MMMIVIIIVIIRADTHSYKAILIRESRRNLAVANNDSDSEYDDIIDSEYYMTEKYHFAKLLS